MDPTILVFAWFWLGQQPATSQIPFSTMALCQSARQNLIDDRKRALQDNGDARRVPQLTAVCLAAGEGKPAPAQAAAQAAAAAPVPAAAPASGMDWLIAQPVNLLDWGLQRAANSIESVRSIRVVSDVNGAPKDDLLDVDFFLAETGRLKYTIQGTVSAKAAGQVSDPYCVAALKSWRQAVLKSSGDKPAASLDRWFSNAERSPADRPKGLADSIAANFDFKMTVVGPEAQQMVSCATPFAVDPPLPAAPAKPPAAPPPSAPPPAAPPPK